MQVLRWWASEICQPALQLWFNRDQYLTRPWFQLFQIRVKGDRCFSVINECGLLHTLNLTLLWLATKMPAVMAANQRHLELVRTCSHRSSGCVPGRPAGCQLAQIGQMLADWWCAGTGELTVQVLVRLNYMLGIQLEHVSAGCIFCMPIITEPEIPPLDE